MEIINGINTFIFSALTVLYFYQFIFIFVALIGDRKKQKTVQKEITADPHRFAFVIAARNERNVIANLIRSIQQQNYPKELIDVFVIADNCTDDTAVIARNSGAIVYERFDQSLVGKGYALDYAFHKINEEHGGYKHYDGYFIFDADNIVDANYTREMNKVFQSGYRVITSYRNSKNYDTNWITAGYSLWFLREAKFLNNPRMMLKSSCAVSGTGYLVSSQIIEKYDGWKFNLLTEDIQFSVVNILEGEKIGYCGKAIFYDEQPTTFRQSWTQRMRWSKGFYQVIYHYGRSLLSNMFKRKSMFSSCYDMFMTLAPSTLLSIFLIVVNLGFVGFGAADSRLLATVVPATIKAIVYALVNFYFMLLMMGIVTTITEWHKIIATPGRKIFYLFTFPLFMMTYIPISVIALVKKVEWKPITHTISTSVEDLEIARQMKN